MCCFFFLQQYICFLSPPDAANEEDLRKPEALLLLLFFLFFLNDISDRELFPMKAGWCAICHSFLPASRLYVSKCSNSHPQTGSLSLPVL